MKNLKAFYTFYIAANSSNYTDAARKLFITHGAVSKQIRILEDYVGHTLFFRCGKNMVLTAAGKQLSTYVEQGFTSLEMGINKLRNETKNTLNVSCEPTLTMRWLMPRLAAFHNQHPEIDIQLSTAGGPITLDPIQLPLAIRRHDFKPEAYYHQKTLVREWIGPVCSPEYWKKYKHNLSDITLLHSQTRTEAWQQWLTKSPQLPISHARNQSFAHFYFCIQAAIDGFGIVIGSYPLICDEIKQGKLIAPFGFRPSGHEYVLLSHPDTNMNSAQQAFSQWLSIELNKAIPFTK